MMLKNLFVPIQLWLLSQKRCVGCGASLGHGTVKEIHHKQTITCKCGRIFIHDVTADTYRRAQFDEVK